VRKDQEKINHLLDINNYYGDHEGSLGPIIKMICVLVIPIAVYYLKLCYIIPGWAFYPLYVIFAIRMALIILGHEKARLKTFKRALYDEYTSLSDMMRIDTIHEDGCVEYVNGQIAYFVITENATTVHSVQRSRAMVKFLDRLTNENVTVDVYSYDLDITDTIYHKYEGANRFKDVDVARDYTGILDYNIGYTDASSVASQTIFVVRGSKEDYGFIKADLKSAINSDATKMFKDCYIADQDMALSIIEMDTGTSIDLDLIKRNKYSTETKYETKLVGYDIVEKENETVIVTDSLGFMPVYKEGLDE